MIAIKLSDDNFEYDIYSLVKAFYPKEDIIFTDDISKDEVSYYFVINYRQVGRYDEIECAMHCIEADGSDLCVYEGSIAADLSDRKESKNRLKRLLYYAISSYSGQTLAWGTLSGIRPVKIALNMIRDGSEDEYISDYMKRTYLTSDDKVNLTIDVAHNEDKLLQGIDEGRDYSIYIGIPFCPSTCLYCSFTSYPISMWQERLDDYLTALRRELDDVTSMLRGKRLTSIYIGGGTPTSLDEEHLAGLLDMIDEICDTSSVLEYNVEAGRADSITEAKLEIIKSHGVSRISINPQTMSDKTLRVIGRAHTSEDVIRSYKLARRMGMDNINMDIILGLPGEGIDDLEHTLDVIRTLRPDSLTVHSLAIKRSSRLNINRADYIDMAIYNSAKHMQLASTAATSLGMKPYYLYRQKNMAGNLENVGYALDGKEGLYNVLIMEEKQSIIAFGAGAYSKYVTHGGRDVTRSENVKEPELYIRRIDEMIERKRNRLEEIGWLIS